MYEQRYEDIDSFSAVSSFINVKSFFYANFVDYIEKPSFIQHSTTKLIKPQKKYWKSKCVRPLFMGRWVPSGSVLFTYHFRGEYVWLPFFFFHMKGEKNPNIQSYFFFSWPFYVKKNLVMDQVLEIRFSSTLNQGATDIVIGFGISRYDFQISVSISVSADKKIQNIGGYRYRPIWKKAYRLLPALNHA